MSSRISKVHLQKLALDASTQEDEMGDKSFSFLVIVKINFTHESILRIYYLYALNSQTFKWYHISPCVLMTNARDPNIND